MKFVNIIIETYLKQIKWKQTYSLCILVQVQIFLLKSDNETYLLCITEEKL